jgi:hypothetical protein
MLTPYDGTATHRHIVHPTIGFVNPWFCDFSSFVRDAAGSLVKSATRWSIRREFAAKGTIQYGLPAYVSGMRSGGRVYWRTPCSPARRTHCERPNIIDGRLSLIPETQSGQLSRNDMTESGTRGLRLRNPPLEFRTLTAKDVRSGWSLKTDRPLKLSCRIGRCRATFRVLTVVA